MDTLKFKNKIISPDDDEIPKKKTFAFWVNISVPIIFAIFIGLISFIGNGFSEDIKEIKGQIKEVDNTKVDNETLQLMIKNQSILIEQQKEDAAHKREEDTKKFEQIQKTQTETLKQLQYIQMDRTRNPRSSSTVINQNSEKAVLTPEEFNTYMNMHPEIKIKYKIYLQSLGKDVSSLP